MKILIGLVILLLLISPISSGYIPLPYKQTLSKAQLSETVSVNFEVKDIDGNPLNDTLIIIQGVVDPSFSKNLITGSDGRASITLNKYEAFIYIVYKLSYEDKTGSFDTYSDQDIFITLNKLPDNQWYFYYFNNGDIELKFKSLDDDVNYNAGEYVNNIVEVKNVAGRNINLIKEKTVFQVVDNLTSNRLLKWGSFKHSQVLIDLTLKKDGWLKGTVQDGIVEVCAGNVIGYYKGKSFDLSGSEFICGTDDSKNLIPEWILKNYYKFSLYLTYQIDGIEKIFNESTQEFFIDNIDWKPEITSSPPATALNAGQEWTYQIATPVYLDNFLKYKLEKSPSGMSIDETNGILKWTPVFNGNYEVIIRAYHEYFENDHDTIAYVDQTFTLNVSGGQDVGNIYADNLYIFNRSVKVGGEVKTSFKVYNDNSKTNSFSYKVQIGDGNFLTYKINDMKPYSKRTIYTSWKYTASGSYNPLLMVDSNNEIIEIDENDNSNGFGSIEVTN